MRQRGRKSAAAVALFPLANNAMKRPEAPKELTPEQADEWRAIVNSQRPDHFTRESQALLVQYCRHTVTANKLAAMIAKAESGLAKDPFNTAKLDAYDKLLKIHEREGRALSSLATRMRLSQQSRYDRQLARKASDDSSVRKPWER
jgi:phage terminase small subunit